MGQSGDGSQSGNLIGTSERKVRDQLAIKKLGLELIGHSGKLTNRPYRLPIKVSCGIGPIGHHIQIGPANSQPGQTCNRMCAYRNQSVHNTQSG